MGKTLLFATILTVLGILGLQHQARATPCSQAHVFVTSEVLTATVLNANPSNFVNCFSQIDNTNIGANGVFASQIIPTTVGQATFGGTVGYTFGHGLTVSGGMTLSGGLTLTGGFSISGGLTVSTGNLTVTTGNLLLTAGQVTAGSSTYTATAATVNGTIRSLNSSVAYELANNAGGAQITSISADNMFSVQTINDTVFGITANSVGSLYAFDTTGDLGLAGGVFSGGTISGIANGSTRSYVPPTYTSSGAAVASTLHGVFASCGTGGTGQCTITFTGAAVFAGQSTYSCSVSPSASSGADYVKATIGGSGSQVSLAIYLSSGSLDTGYNNTLTTYCVGT